MKFFKERAHAEALVAGHLYMNTLQYFHDLEAQSDGQRADQHEGLVAWFHPKTTVVTVGDIVIPSDDLAAPVTVHESSLLTRHAYCMFQLDSRGYEQLSADSLADFKERLMLPPELDEFGSFVLFLTSASKFVARFAAWLAALRCAGTRVEAGDAAGCAGYPVLASLAGWIGFSAV